MCVHCRVRAAGCTCKVRRSLGWSAIVHWASSYPTTLQCTSAHLSLCLPLRRYEAVQPLHRSWLQYMQELLAGAGSTPRPSSSRGGAGSSSSSNDVEVRLYAADLHGCLIRVSHTTGECWEREVLRIGQH